MVDTVVDAMVDALVQEQNTDLDEAITGPRIIQNGG